MQNDNLMCQSCGGVLKDGMDIFMCWDSWYCSETCRHHGRMPSCVFRAISRPADMPRAMLPTQMKPSRDGPRINLPNVSTIALFDVPDLCS